MEFLPGTSKTAMIEAEKIKTEYGIEDGGGLHLLASFAAALSTELDCQKQIEMDGLIIPDRFKQKKPHPLLAVLRDSRAQKVQALKGLNLDLEPGQAGPGRPPGK